MTYTELINEVDLLAPESTDNPALMLSSANRALKDLYNRVRVTKTVRLAVQEVKPVTHYKEIKCVSGQPYTLFVKGLAYSMRVQGSGRIYISSNNEEKVERVECMYETKLLKGFITDYASITFWGSFTFTIYDLAIYDQVFSDNIDDIPECGSTITIDLRKTYGDFMSFLSPALDPDGNLVEECTLIDGKAVIDSEYGGEILLTYRRLPSQIQGEADEIIDLPEEYSHLYPLLISHYSMLCIDQARSNFYRTLFEEGMTLLESKIYDNLEYKYPMTNSWA